MPEACPKHPPCVSSLPGAPLLAAFTSAAATLQNAAHAYILVSCVYTCAVLSDNLQIRRWWQVNTYILKLLEEKTAYSCMVLTEQSSPGH